MLVARLALFDEVTIFGVARRVDEEGDTILTIDLRYGFEVRHRDRLPTSGVVRDGHHPERNLFDAIFFDEGAQLAKIHVPFEGMCIGRIICIVDDEVCRSPAAGADVGIGGVEVHIARHPLIRLDQHCAQNIFRRAALVGRDEMLEPEDVLHRGFETLERACAGVRLVAAHDRRPLLLAHRAGARVGEQIDEDILGFEGEDVIACLDELRLALLWRDQADRFGDLDTKRFRGIMHEASFLVLAV